ncbi:MAG: protein kinase, partial [Acidobacteriota bacterium]|nr:protein kinase [Acidobacteriota bacterium]
MSEPGTLASGRFTIQRRIGAGGMGVVYEAFDRDRRQSVALKKLLGTDAAAIVRIKHEFRALADVVHPNLVRLFELIGEGDDWFFTMELVEGADFLNYARGRRSSVPFDATTEQPTTERATLVGERARRFDITPRPLESNKEAIIVTDYAMLRRTLRQLAEGVAALHDNGKLHRDLKPSNVLITPAERVVVLDFGLATDIAAYDRKLTFGGTPAYMAPEQIAEMPATEASDCYAMGVMLYEALTGTLPFSGNFYSMLMQKRTSDPKPPIEIVGSIPEDLSSACVDLLRRDPASRPSARELAERLQSSAAPAATPSITISRSREMPFVGRIAQLEQLESALRASERGSAVLVLLRGASGMGKSSLVRHFLHEVQRRDSRAVVFTGRSYEQESVPYKAVDSLIDDLARYLRRVSALEAKALLPTDAAALARLFPVLQELDAVVKARRRPLDIRDSQELRRRAFAALRELFARMSDERRVILFLDDVQWGDRDSAALLAEVLRPPDAPPLLVIAAHRIEEAESSPMLAELAKIRDADRNALGEVREIALSELSAAESQDLTRALLHDTSGRHVDTIAREAGGSPFFIVELSRFSDTTSFDTAELTGGEMMLDDVIRSRIAQLPQGGRELLEVVAVSGRPIVVTAANRASDLHRDDVAMVARLRADHLLRTRVRGGREELDTYHDRIREAILSTLPRERKRAHHLTIARTLEDEGLRDPEVLTVHYREAGDNARAASFAIEAGDRAAAALAFESAADFYEMALSLAGGAADPLVQKKLADALANAGRGADAATHYLDAAQAAEGAEALELRRKAMECLLRAGHVDGGLRLIRDVLDAVGLALPATPKRAVAGILLNRVRLLARGLKAEERAATAVDPQQLTRIDVCWGVVTGLARIDNIRSAYFQPIHLRLALEAGEPYRLTRALAAEACFSATRGEKAKVHTEKLVSRVDRSARAIGEPHAIGMSAMARAMESYYLGHFRDAVQNADAAEAIFRERCTGVSWEISTTVNYALCSLMYLGDLSQLTQRVPQRLREAEVHGDLYAGIDPVCRPGIVWLANDEPETARRSVRQVMDRWSLQGFHFQHYLEMFAENQTDLYLGNWASAWRRSDERWPLMKSAFLLRIPFVKLEALHLVGRCALAAAIGSGDMSLVARAEKNANEIEKEKAAWAQPFALALRAGVAAIRNRTEEARDALSQAARAFEKHEMLLYAKAAEHRRGTLTGGAGGRAIAANADGWLRARGVQNVPRLLDVLMPGFT